MMNEYLKQAMDFLERANASIKIEFMGIAINRTWKEKVKRNLYNVTISTPLGSMEIDFWDSINNTEITLMSTEEYAKKRFKCEYNFLGATDKAIVRKELKAKKENAVPDAYDILACITKYDPCTFEDFCADYGYDEDSRSALEIYLAVSKEYRQVSRIFTEEQMEELREIN